MNILRNTLLPFGKPVILLLQRLLPALAVVLVLLPNWGECAPPAGSDPTAGTLIVYVQEGCPHCAAAKNYLAELARQRPDLRIDLRPVDRDEQAERELIEHFRKR